MSKLKINPDYTEIPIQPEFVERVNELKANNEAISLIAEKLEEKYGLGNFTDNWTRFVLDGKPLIIGG